MIFVIYYFSKALYANFVSIILMYGIISTAKVTVKANQKSTPKAEKPSDNGKPDSKDKNNNQGIISSERHGLPATGENERIAMTSIILGLILLVLGAVVSISRFKKLNK